MFNNLIRELEQLSGTHTMSIPIEADENGYVDKECPSPDCQFQFKVFFEDWKNLFKDEAVFCPLCRHEAPANSWWTTEQIEDGRRQITRHIEGRLDQAIDQDAREFNRKQPRNAFISMSVKTTGGKPYHFLLPIPAKEAMELQITCDQCGARYAVIGCAFFCPCCGHNSVERTFDDSLKKVEIKLDNLPIIKKALSKDEAEITCRSLIETGLTDCVVAFQRFAEEVYKKKTNNQKIPFNVFQRIDDGSKLWKDLLTEGYEDWLTPIELNELKILYQKRHLLAHSEGIVDEQYIKRSGGDTTYKIGQRIVIKEHDVRKLVSIIRKLSAKTRA